MADTAIDDNTHTRRVQRQPRSDSGLSPDEASRQAEEALKARDIENTRLRDENRRLADTAAKAHNTLADTATQRIAEQETQFTSSIAAAERARDSAMTALQTAMESGDVKGQLVAQDQLTDAKVDIRVLKEKKAQFEADKPRLEKLAKDTRDQTPKPASNVSSATQAWYDDHPLFHTDDEYNSVAMAAHNLALKRGLKGDTQGYFDFLNTQLAKTYGQNHGKVKSVKQDDHANAGDSSSMAAPPGGGGDDGRGFRSQLQELRGLSLTYKGDGTPELTGRITPEVRQWAEANGYKDEKGAISYAISMLQIEEEQRKNPYGGLMANGEGRTYR